MRTRFRVAWAKQWLKYRGWRIWWNDWRSYQLMRLGTWLHNRAQDYREQNGFPIKQYQEPKRYANYRPERARRRPR